MTAVAASLELISRPFSATVVIVLYRMKPEDSPAFQSVMEARRVTGTAAEAIRVVLWDNSPEPARPGPLADGVIYMSDPRNLGLATAYNRALEMAAGARSEWLITLDQDTSVPRDYFLTMRAAAEESARIAGIGAVVPQIVAGGRIVSPNYFLFGALPRWYRSGYRGVPSEAVFAFNSAAMLKVTALEQAGGYDPWFWLDNSDAEIFRRLHQLGKRVYVAGDIQVQHEFSMKNMNRQMSAERYRNALMAESAFWDLTMNWWAGCERTLRLLLRLIKHWRRKDNPELRSITRDALKRRLFVFKSDRIEEWRRKTRERLGDAIESSRLQPGSQRISACMAAYNGGRFIDAQLKSILSQLRENDEVVIVDDCSRDDTVDRIVGFGDPRICLFKHSKNQGVVATFEDALRSATGDLLFLCDDDDVWAPAKVEKFLGVFEARPDVEIVTSRVQLIDEDDVEIPSARVNRGGKFMPGFWQNLFINHYQGSAMAIRASLLGRVLPFPRRKLFLHDAWIGTRNEAEGGKAVFIDEDLLLYRRHPHNASRKQSIPRQIRTRINLLAAHISHALRLSTL